jgi:carbon monoxide dehydrogenase subunit G
MNFTGRYAIPAPPEMVWQALNDAVVLKACIPGCEQLDKTSATEFRAVATLRIGPVKATFRGKIALTDLEPPRHCRLVGEGQGGVAGFAKGDAEVELEPEGAGTLLSYKAHAAVGGKLAQIGQRLLDGAARQIADDFFARFSKALAPKAELTPDPEGDVATLPATESTERESKGSEVWILGAIGIVAILLVLLGRVL